MPCARYQRNCQKSTLVVVIIGDGELLTSAPSSVAGELSLVRTGFYASLGRSKSRVNLPTSFLWLTSVHVFHLLFIGIQIEGPMA